MRIKPPNASVIMAMRIQPFLRIVPIKAILLYFIEYQKFMCFLKSFSEKRIAKIEFWC